jgi:hypothetical protein
MHRGCIAQGAKDELPSSYGCITQGAEGERKGSNWKGSVLDGCWMSLLWAFFSLKSTG